MNKARNTVSEKIELTLSGSRYKHTGAKTNEARKKWNAVADIHNQWENLSIEEQEELIERETNE